MKKKSFIYTIILPAVLLLISAIPISSCAASDTAASASNYSVTVNNHTELTLKDVVLTYDNQDLHCTENIKSGKSHTFVLKTTGNPSISSFIISGKTNEGKSFSKLYTKGKSDDCYITLTSDSDQNLSPSSAFPE